MKRNLQRLNALGSAISCLRMPDVTRQELQRHFVEALDEYMRVTPQTVADVRAAAVGAERPRFCPGCLSGHVELRSPEGDSGSWWVCLICGVQWDTDDEETVTIRKERCHDVTQ